jgi:alpha-galactosidase
MSQDTSCPQPDLIKAVRIIDPLTLDARNPAPEWDQSSPVTFCADWQGKNHDPARETAIRVLWAPETLYVRFECRYRELFTFEDSDPNGRRDHLWDRDVAEAFLQPATSSGRYYKEFEVSPNGLWIDLDIFPGGLAHLDSGLQRSVWLDDVEQFWAAELAIPMNAITTQFDANDEWRVNFFRIEGTKEPRFYSAWQPTNTPKPNFHVPSAFGRMRFESSPVWRTPTRS